MYAGDEAIFIRAEAYQLLLRMYIAVLVDEYGFPKELEVRMRVQRSGSPMQVIARDLWAVYISTRKLLPAPLESEPTQAPGAAAAEPVEEKQDFSDPDDLPDDDDLADELDALREGPKEGDKDDEGGAGSDVEKRGGVAKRARNRVMMDQGAFSVHAPLVLAYLACYSLRLPVMLADLHRYAPALSTTLTRQHGRVERAAVPALASRSTARDGRAHQLEAAAL